MLSCITIDWGITVSDILAVAEWIKTVVDEPNALRDYAAADADSIRAGAMSGHIEVVGMSPPFPSLLAETIEWKLAGSPLTEAQREIAAQLAADLRSPA